MKAHIFQHVPFEEPAAVYDWLTLNGFDVLFTRFYENPVLPEINGVDWLIIMGGPMSVNDEQTLPWLAEEKKFIKQCIDSGKVVVGICLGAQLIANSLGCKVYMGANKEIGWFPLNMKNSLNLLPDKITVFHWHGETFDLPHGAQLIASSEGCTNQIFVLGNNVLGMQCHLEMTNKAIFSMLKHCSHEIIPAPYIQTADEITLGTEKFSSKANQVLFALLSSLMKQH